MSVQRDTERRPKAAAFIERWTQRKQAARPHETEPGAVQTALSAQAGGTAPAPQPALTDADMPPLETLDADSDYAGFLSDGVSDQLRRLALRKLFKLPGLCTRDGLDDYDDDFTCFVELKDTLTHDMQRMLARQLQRDSGMGEQAADASAAAGEGGEAQSPPADDGPPPDSAVRPDTARS